MAKSRQLTDVASLAALPCACSNLRRASRAVTQLYSEELRKVGLEPTQFTLLLALSRVGEITQGGLGARHAIDSTTLTRTLSLLRKKGWIETKAGVDRREKRLRLTAAGRRQLHQGYPHWERAQRRLQKALGDSGWNHVQATLTQIAEAAQKG